MALRIRFLLVVSSLVVVCAIGAVVYVVAHSRPAGLTTDPATSNAAASVDEPREEAAARWSSPQLRQEPAEAATSPDAIAAGERMPDSSPPAPDEQLEAEEWPADDQPAVVMTKGDNGSHSTSINFRALAAAGPSIPMAAQVKAMELTDGQRAAIEQFETAFQQSIKDRLDHQAQAFQVMKEELRIAVASGDQRLLDQTSQRFREIGNEQAALVRQLNREYLDGIRTYLSTEEAEALEKSVSRTDGAWHSGGTVLVRSPRADEKPEEP